MLDPACLPKNANGFRTTHTCELCGFEPKTKNKYREKQDHLVMKHFKDRIDKIFPHCRPYTCPNNECDFTGKDKQALLRHYTGKHGVLELYLREALAEKGILYQLSDSAKRKSMGHTENPVRRAKEPRLFQLSPPPSIQEQGNETMLADTTTHLDTDLSDIIYTTRLPAISTTRLPAIATTRLPTISTTQLPTISTARLSVDATPPTRLPSVPTTKLPSMSTVMSRPFTSHGKCDVDALLASFQPIDAQLVLSMPPQDLPLDSPLVSSTTPDFYSSMPDEPCKMVLNDNIMWGGGSLAVAESAQTVPVHYLDSSESGFINLGDIDYDYLCPATIEPMSVLTGSNSERQLSFSML